MVHSSPVSSAYTPVIVACWHGATRPVGTLRPAASACRLAVRCTGSSRMVSLSGCERAVGLPINRSRETGHPRVVGGDALAAQTGGTRGAACLGVASSTTGTAVAVAAVPDASVAAAAVPAAAVAFRSADALLRRVIFWRRVVFWCRARVGAGRGVVVRDGRGNV